jgi:hypothetical protein
MNDLTQYLAVRNQIRAGDLIAFEGRDVLSSLIEVFGNGPSHIAIVRGQDTANQASPVTITESTIIDGRNGVQTNRLSERLASYDTGSRAWWLPLSDEIRREIDWFEFYKFIGASEDHVKYDTLDLFEFIARGIPILGPRIGQKEKKQMVCSGFVTAVLESCGVLRGINWSKTTPGDLTSMRLYRDCVQILGAPGTIHDFNTV